MSRPGDRIKPVSVVGRCATCECGALVELPAPGTGPEAERVHYIRCTECIRILEVEEPHRPGPPTQV